MTTDPHQPQERCEHWMRQSVDEPYECTRPAPASTPAQEVVWRCCEFLPRAINRKPEDCEMVKEKAREAREQATHLAVENTLIKFYDEIRAEEVDNCGYIDLDAIENIYCTLMAAEALRSQQQGGDHP